MVQIRSVILRPKLPGNTKVRSFKDTCRSLYLRLLCIYGLTGLFIVYFVFVIYLLIGDYVYKTICSIFIREEPKIKNELVETAEIHENTTTIDME